jgi:hypothetical protein
MKNLVKPIILKRGEKVFLGRFQSKAQSTIEVAVLLSIVLAALLMMQGIMKRGFQGSLKEASDRMGEQYSTSGSASRFQRTMLNDQEINEEVNTKRTAGASVGIDQFIPAGFGYDPKYVGDQGVYTYTSRFNQAYSTTQEEKMDSTALELYRYDDYQAAATTYPDFADPFPIP